MLFCNYINKKQEKFLLFCIVKQRNIQDRTYFEEIKIGFDGNDINLKVGQTFGVQLIMQVGYLGNFEQV